MTQANKDQREKFFIRFDDEHTRSTITSIADQQHISMNAWILQAIDEKLVRGKRFDRLLEAAETMLVTEVRIEAPTDPELANKVAEHIKTMGATGRLIAGMR